MAHLPEIPSSKKQIPKTKFQAMVLGMGILILSWVY
jgi:hypothetical protein